MEKLKKLVISIPLIDSKHCEWPYRHKFATKECWVSIGHCIHCGIKNPDLK